MKKIILGLSLLVATSLNLQAGSFIGIDIGANTLTSEGGFEDTGAIYGAKIGSTNGNWRAYVGFNYFDSEDSHVEQTEGYVSADYIFFPEDSMFRPFVGGTVGYAFTDYDYYEVDDSFTWGVQAGVILNLDPHFEIEGGIKYAGYSMDIAYAYPYEPIDIFDDKYNFFIGANYKF